MFLWVTENEREIQRELELLHLFIHSPNGLNDQGWIGQSEEPETLSWSPLWAQDFYRSHSLSENVKRASVYLLERGVAERERERERKRNILSVGSLAKCLQHPTPGLGQEPWTQGSRTSFAIFLGPFKRAGLEVEQPGFTQVPMWDASNVCSSLTCYVTALAHLNFFFHKVCGRQTFNSVS